MVNASGNTVEDQGLWRRRRRALPALVIVMALAACASPHPMGLSEQEWQALPPERQAELRVREAELRAERQAAREAEARRRTEQAAEAERIRQEELAVRRANARFGDILAVTLQGGTMESGNDLFALEPLAFEILRGERKRITLVGRRGEETRVHRMQDHWWVRYSEDGLTLVLNESGYGSPIILVDDGAWEKGQALFLAAQGQLKSGGIDLSGMSASIRYREAPGKPPRLILEQR